MAYYTKIPSLLGEITLHSYDGKCLSGLWLDTQTPRISEAERWEHAEVFAAVQRWLDEYFTGNMPVAEKVALDLRGTEFQLRVWNELCRIPYGTTLTYGELADRIGCRSAQAVGQAVGRNPVSVIVPCHRIIGKNGTLTGYTGGLAKKRELLQLEGIRL